MSCSDRGSDLSLIVDNEITSPEEASLSVRDMIKLYNLATEMNQELKQAKSIFLQQSKTSRTELEDCGDHVEPDNRIKLETTAQNLSRKEVRIIIDVSIEPSNNIGFSVRTEKSYVQ